MIEVALVYGSTRGNTRKVAERLRDALTHPVTLIRADELHDAKQLNSFTVVLFFASTWGDGELQQDMESLLLRMPLRLDGKRYAVCELGNYYGYDDFEFGALRILQHFLNASGGIELLPPFSMDSLPTKDWLGLQRWTAELEQALLELA